MQITILGGGGFLGRKLAHRLATDGALDGRAVTGLTLTSANDAADRDPTSFLLSGSYDGTNFTMIASNSVPEFPTRFFKNYLFFPNSHPFTTYKLIFPTVNGSTCCMQISEVELLGFLAPTDVTVPGDPIVASSNNSPGSEGVANAIDNQPTKYLNFDKLNTGFTVTPSVGGTIVIGLSLTSANDAPERDRVAPVFGLQRESSVAVPAERALEVVGSADRDEGSHHLAPVEADLDPNPGLSHRQPTRRGLRGRNLGGRRRPRARRAHGAARRR